MVERSIKLNGETVRAVLPLELVSSLGFADGCHVQWRLGDNFLLLDLTDNTLNSRVTTVTRSSATKETLMVTIPIDFARTLGFSEGDRINFSLYDGSLKLEKVIK